MLMTEKGEKIMQIMEDLSLEACADTISGNELIRGISGGENKNAHRLQQNFICSLFPVYITKMFDFMKLSAKGHIIHRGPTSDALNTSKNGVLFMDPMIIQLTSISMFRMVPTNMLVRGPRLISQITIS